MQVKSILRLSVAVILITALASCHKKNTQGRYVPNDAALVIVANGQSLSTKLSWDDIKQNPLFQKLLGDSTVPANAKTILSNPDSSGVDVKADLVVFVEKDSVGGYTSIQGNIKDSNLFRKFVATTVNGGSETEQDGVNYISHYPVCIGWNKDKFIVVADVPSMGNSVFNRRLEADSIDIPTKSSRDIGATCKAIFALSESNSLAQNEKFTKLLKETGDMHFWVNTQKLYSKMLAASPLSVLNTDDLNNGNITAGTLSFDNGKISINTKSYMNDKTLAFYKQYVNGKINDEMLQHIPGKDVAGAVALNFDPAAIKAILKQLNLDGIANMKLQQANLTLDDIVTAFKGDFVVAASDFSIKVDSAENKFGTAPAKIQKEKADGNYIFAASIGDKDAFNKIFNTAKVILSQSGDGNLPFSFDNNGTYFVLSNKKDNVSSYLGSNTSNFDFINKINGQPFGGYFNLHALIVGLGSGAVEKDSISQAMYDASVKMWNTVYWKSGKLDGDVATGSIEINLANNSTNSLKQLNQYISTIGKLYKEKEASIKETDVNTIGVDTIKASTVQPD